MAEFNNLTDQFLILDRNDLTPTERLVALTLLSFRNSDTGRCNPPIYSDDSEKKTICSRTGFTRQCVIKTLSSLEQKKIILCKKVNAKPSEITFTVNDDYRKQGLPLTTFTDTVNDDYRSSKRRLPITKKEQINNKEEKENTKEKDSDSFSLTPVEKTPRRTPLKKPENVTQQTWDDFNAIRKAKKAPLTETALKRIGSEAEKAKIDLETALQVCCERGWQGFKADWYTKDTAQAPARIRSQPNREPTPDDFTDRQIGLFAYRLATYQRFCSDHPSGLLTTEQFASKIQSWLRHPTKFQECLPYLKRLNLIH